MNYSEVTKDNMEAWILRENAIEKMSRTGVRGLTNRELVCLSLIDNASLFSTLVMDSALQAFYKSTNTNELISELSQIEDIKTDKILEILALSEILRRKQETLKKALTQPADVFQVIKHYFSETQENFIVVGVNGANEQIFSKVVTTGLINQTLAHPREVYVDAVTSRCTSIFIAHNHPSGHTKPSSDDIAITTRIKDAGEILGIRLLDHIIFTDTNYFSFKEHNLVL